MIACNNSGHYVIYDFVEVNKIVEAGATTKKVKDYELSRYACYLIVQNGDPRKEVIALGQTYFAIQTYRQEIADRFNQLDEDTKQLVVRGDIKNAELSDKVNRGQKENALKCKANGGTVLFRYKINSDRYYEIDSHSPRQSTSTIERIHQKIHCKNRTYWLLVNQSCFSFYQPSNHSSSVSMTFSGYCPSEVRKNSSSPVCICTRMLYQ